MTVVTDHPGDGSLSHWARKIARSPASPILIPKRARGFGWTDPRVPWEGLLSEAVSEVPAIGFIKFAHQVASGGGVVFRVGPVPGTIGVWQIGF